MAASLPAEKSEYVDSDLSSDSNRARRHSTSKSTFSTIAYQSPVSVPHSPVENSLDTDVSTLQSYMLASSSTGGSTARLAIGPDVVGSIEVKPTARATVAAIMSGTHRRRPSRPAITEDPVWPSMSSIQGGGSCTQCALVVQ